MASRSSCSDSTVLLFLLDLTLLLSAALLTAGKAVLEGWEAWAATALERCGKTAAGSGAGAAGVGGPAACMLSASCAAVAAVAARADAAVPVAARADAAVAVAARADAASSSGEGV